MFFLTIIYLIYISSKDGIIIFTYYTYFQSRVNSGKMNEDFYEPIIEKDIKEQLQNNNTFNLSDFENENFKIELKTREVTKDKYKTTIVGYDKI